jgi:hypothetical protein
MTWGERRDRAIEFWSRSYFNRAESLGVGCLFLVLATAFVIYERPDCAEHTVEILEADARAKLHNKNVVPLGTTLTTHSGFFEAPHSLLFDGPGEYVIIVCASNALQRRAVILRKVVQ